MIHIGASLGKKPLGVEGSHPLLSPVDQKSRRRQLLPINQPMPILTSWRQRWSRRDGEEGGEGELMAAEEEDGHDAGGSEEGKEWRRRRIEKKRQATAPARFNGGCRREGGEAAALAIRRSHGAQDPVEGVPPVAARAMVEGRKARRARRKASGSGGGREGRRGRSLSSLESSVGSRLMVTLPLMLETPERKEVVPPLLSLSESLVGSGSMVTLPLTPKTPERKEAAPPLGVVAMPYVIPTWLRAWEGGKGGCREERWWSRITRASIREMVDFET